jgi:hypothetical protein
MPRQRRRSSGSSPPEIVVDIDDVTPQSKLSELTVEQFVQLLMQTSTQSHPPRSSNQRRAEAIAELISVLKSDSEPVNAIKKSFAEIGRTLPQVLLEVARRIREAQEAHAREAQAQSARQAEPNGSHAQTHEPHAQTQRRPSDA